MIHATKTRWNPKRKTWVPLDNAKYFSIADLQDDPSKAEDWIRETTRRDWHVYLIRNPRQRPRKGQRRYSNMGNVEWVVSAIGDFDHCTYAQVRTWLQATNAPRPTLVVSSGNGIHCYWYARTPISVRHDFSRARKALELFTNRWIARGLPLDPQCKDIPRALRVPGSLNHKTIEFKPCKVLEFHPGLSYEWSELIPDFKDQDLRETTWEEALLSGNTPCRSSVEPHQDGRKESRNEGTSADRSLSLPLPPSPDGDVCGESKKAQDPSLQIPGEGAEEIQWAAVSAIVRSVEIKVKGQRNGLLFHFVGPLKRAYPALTKEQRRAIHDIWHSRWFERTETDVARSFEEFERAWERFKLPKTQEAFIQGLRDSDLVHPRLMELPQDRRNEKLRRLLNAMWTASKGGTSVFPMSARVAGRLLGCSWRTAVDLIDKLLDRGLIERKILGSRRIENGHMVATVYGMTECRSAIVSAA